jgi:glycosyltransferase involved in cell wall biosynthesis
MADLSTFLGPPPQPVKVVHITAVAGTLRVILPKVLLAVKRAGFDLRAVCSPGEAIPEVESAGITIQRIPISRRIAPLRDLISLWRLSCYLRREKVDIVHAHTPKAGLLARLAARLVGVPIIVYTVHGFYFHDDMPWLPRNFYVLLEKVGAWCCNMLLPVSSEDVRTAVAKKIAPAEKVRYLGGGIDIDDFRPGRFSLEEIRRRRAEFGIPADAVVVGIVARMVREKGYLEMFEAFAKLMTKFPKLYLLQIGGQDREKVDAISPDSAEPYAIMDHARFLGDRGDVPDLLQLMDILALPSYREGLPVSLMEASASGLPVVSTRVRGCREVVVDGETGLLVSARDASGLAAALEKLIVSPEMRARMGAAGRQRVVQHYDQRRMFRIVLETYRGLLRERHLPEPDGLQREINELAAATGDATGVRPE